MLSEGDFVVKICGPILENLFAGTSVILHWGDTLSEIGEDNETSRRSVSKLYHDKEKLTINGKAQLNKITEIYNGIRSSALGCRPRDR